MALTTQACAAMVPEAAVAQSPLVGPPVECYGTSGDCYGTSPNTAMNTALLYCTTDHGSGIKRRIDFRTEPNIEDPSLAWLVIVKVSHMMFPDPQR